MSPRSLSFVFLLCCAPLVGCEKDPSGSSDDSGEPSAAAPSDLPDPGFSVSAETKNALFTWVDKDGSFRITEKPDEVPEHARKTVRVVVEDHPPGSAEHVFVVNLSRVKDGGEFPVRTITRTEWEILGKKQRDAKIAALIPADEPADPSPKDLGVDAIVYGADWCKPCHLAEDYLKKKGARVVKKDIEEDPSANAEMRRKLKKAGMGGSSIPILDVGGTMLKGFSEGAIDAALKRAAR